MDFQSLGTGNPFYVLRKGEKPILEVGVVKSKSRPRAKFPTNNPTIMTGLKTAFTPILCYCTISEFNRL